MTGEPPAFPFPHPPGARPPDRFGELTGEPGLPRVVLPSGVPALLATRHADVRAVLSDDRFSREAYRGRPMFARSNASLALATSDPPVHARRRGAVAPEFTGRRARAQTPRLRELAAEAGARLRSRPRPADLLADFTVPFALSSITETLGVPDEDGEWLRPAMSAMMSAGSHTPEQVEAAHGQMHGYFGDLVARRRAEIDRGTPDEGDLITRLLCGRGTDRLGDDEVAVFGSGMMMAGFETTANQLAVSALYAFCDPALAARLRANPEEVGPFLEETLRSMSLIGTGGAAHVALEDVQLGDVLVPAGEVVVPLTAAANVDPAVFADPDVFDPGRRDNPHVAFGYGRHYCLGAPLARAQLRAGLDELLGGFSNLCIAVAEEDVEWRTGQFIRGPVRLPVSWDDHAGEAVGQRHETGSDQPGAAEPSASEPAELAELAQLEELEEQSCPWSTARTNERG
ncbi:MAG TPA: cytochrome P450 [Actinocrinis sp.]|nr:cytochrome P450 [Actinocrinis sp.]